MLSKIYWKHFKVRVIEWEIIRSKLYEVRAFIVLLKINLKTCAVSRILKK